MKLGFAIALAEFVALIAVVAYINEQGPGIKALNITVQPTEFALCKQDGCHVWTDLQINTLATFAAQSGFNAGQEACARKRDSL